MKKILLLGSGELGKEFTIAAQRLGQHVIACDNYAGAPAMQVADEYEVFSMLDGKALDATVAKHRPDVIICEIEAIRTERLYDYEQQGIHVVPSARAVNFTMNRKAIRDLAAQELGLKTAQYFYATTLEELQNAADQIGYPCIVKPLMSSSGKGQSLVKNANEIPTAFEYGMAGSRGDVKELIVEEFINFDYEITLLTVTQDNGNTLFCPPIGHVQKGGDYRESFQPLAMEPQHLEEAQRMAKAITEALTGSGLWGVALGLPIPCIKTLRKGASAVILSTESSSNPPTYKGIELTCEEDADVRIFGKPTTRPNRRMGVVVVSGDFSEDLDAIRNKAKRLASYVEVLTPTHN